MEEQIYQLLKNQIDPEDILDDIAFSFYSLATTHSYLYPNLLDMLFHYRTFKDIVQDFEEAEDITSEKMIILGEILNLIEQELEDSFDTGEDTVKALLQNGPLAGAVLEDFRKRNVLMVQKQLHPDQIEQMYVEAFRKFDRLKERLEQRILSLSPKKAYYQGERRWQAIRERDHILMDETELIEKFKEKLDTETLDCMLYHKYYLAVQFGRHYLPQYAEAEEDDEEDSEELTEEEKFFMDEKEPEILTGDGDLRDQPFEYACELFDQYTGRRVYEEESDIGKAYWRTYGDELYELIWKFCCLCLEETLESIDKEAPEKLANLASRRGISKDDIKSGVEYMTNPGDFKYFIEYYIELRLDQFGEEKHSEVMKKGEEVQAKLDKEGYGERFIPDPQENG